jgi:hypothetical protein
MNLLVPYVPLPDHSDPLFNEFTYGDVDSRGKKLASLKQGDYVFFHTTSRGVKIIMAYYVVDRVLPTVEACSDERICLKYKNPHITYFMEHGHPIHKEHDYVLFGDPILSNVLDRPIKFDKLLATKLSLKIKFRADRSEAQTIGSATRSWRKLTARDVRVLLEAARRAAAAKHKVDLIRSTDEVAETIEKDIEDHLARTPTILGKGLSLKARQLPTRSGRIDLLFQSTQNELVLVEVKLGKIGRGAISQIEGYIADLRSTQDLPVRGAIVCAGVMPAFEEDISKKKNIDIYVYGWTFDVERWRFNSV